MNIVKNGTSLPEVTSPQPRPSAAPAANTKANAVNTGSANVRLSAQYQWLDVTASGNGDGFDAGKVAEIKAAIARGTFQVDPEKIASGLLDTVKDLLATKTTT